MYRGDPSEVTVFDRKKSSYSNLYGRGFYFTNSDSHARQYGRATAYFLDVKNPVSTTECTITKEQMRKFLEVVAENEDDYSFENYGYGATVESVLESIFTGKSDFAMLYDVSQTAIGDMVAATELFNEINGTNYDGFILDTETVIFNSAQAKRVDNRNPTANPDTRYSQRDPDYQKVNQVLEQENAELKEDVSYLKELVDASENYNAAGAQKNTATEGGVQMQVRESFYTEFDAWDKKDTNKVFTVGTTSETLQSVGMKNQNIMLRSGTVLQKLNKHKEMSFETFKGIPELLEHPIIVQFSDAIDSKTNKPKYDSRITVLGELYADGKPVLVSLELLPTNQKKTVVLDFAVITSAYSKGALQQYLNENSILYIDPDKKRTNSWLSLNRLQLPLGENRYGSIRKITYADGKVKVQNPKNMTAMQRALQAAGVVDAYGNQHSSNNETEQHQERTNTLTNWDVLEQAAQMLEGQKKFRTKNLNGKTDLNALEKERAELRERLAKQKELGKEAADTAQIRKQIKDIDIAIEAARATLQLTDGQRYALNEFNKQ